MVDGSSGNEWKRKRYEYGSGCVLASRAMHVLTVANMRNDDVQQMTSWVLCITVRYRRNGTFV